MLTKHFEVDALGDFGAMACAHSPEHGENECHDDEKAHHGDPHKLENVRNHHELKRILDKTKLVQHHRIFLRVQ